MCALMTPIYLHGFHFKNTLLCQKKRLCLNGSSDVDGFVSSHMTVWCISYDFFPYCNKESKERHLSFLWGNKTQSLAYWIRLLGWFTYFFLLLFCHWLAMLSSTNACNEFWEAAYYLWKCSYLHIKLLTAAPEDVVSLFPFASPFTTGTKC